MKDYRISRRHRAGEGYETMVISDRETGERIAEYRLTPGCERSEIAAMRRTIDRHLAEHGSTMHNYGW